MHDASAYAHTQYIHIYDHVHMKHLFLNIMFQTCASAAVASHPGSTPLTHHVHTYALRILRMPSLERAVYHLPTNVLAEFTHVQGF